MFFAPALGVGRRLTLEAWRHCAHKCQIRTPLRKGLTTEAGFCARYATRRKLPRRADRQLDEQACNRDHDSSDPCGQTKKQQKIAQEHRHIAPPLYLPCGWAILTLQALAFVRSPTQEPSRIISCLLPARGFPAIFFTAIIGRLESGAARSARGKRPLSWFAWNVSSPVAFVTRQTNARAVVRNKAEQYRSRARLCLEVRAPCRMEKSGSWTGRL